MAQYVRFTISINLNNTCYDSLMTSLFDIVFTSVLQLVKTMKTCEKNFIGSTQKNNKSFEQ